jgi:glycosyltransferase involved in cell wall biosynthesis
LKQDGVEVEVIIVDDGSTDETAMVVAQHAPKWGKRVRYIWQENAERSAARNKGLYFASGEFVAFLDSDDVWRQDHAKACFTALEQDRESAAAYSEYGLISGDGRVIRDEVRRPRRTGQRFLYDLCIKRLILHPSQVILRRCAVKTNLLFDPEITSGEDWLAWVVLARTNPFRTVGKQTVWLRHHANASFAEPDKYSRSLVRAAEKLIALGIPQELGISSRHLVALNRVHGAYAYYLSNNRSGAVRLLKTALEQYPAIVMEHDFWSVVVRLGAGQRLSSRIRAIRQRPRCLPYTSATRAF